MERQGEAAAMATGGDLSGSDEPTSHPQSVARLVARTAVGSPVGDPTPETLRLYAADWRDFVAWCRATGADPLPATPATLAAYLLAAAPGRSRGAIGRRRAAIGTMHRQHGLPLPALDQAAKAVLRRATQPAAARPAAVSLGPAALRQLAARCPRDLAGLRDRALLLLAEATDRASQGRRHRAQGQAEEGPPDGIVARTVLLGLDAEHVRFTDPGVTLLLRTRADAAVPSRTVALARSASAASCPVRALEDWLRSSDTRFGPVFRKVDRWGNVEHARLGADVWRRIAARRSGTRQTDARRTVARRTVARQTGARPTGTSTTPCAPSGGEE